MKGRYHGAGMPTDDAMAWRNLRDDRQNARIADETGQNRYRIGRAPDYAGNYDWREFETTNDAGDASDEANFDSPEEWMDSLAERRGFEEDEDDEDDEPRPEIPESEKYKRNRGIAQVLGRTANERAKQLHEMGGSPFGLPHQGRSLPKNWNWKSPRPMAKAWTMLKDSAKNWQFCESCKRGYIGEGCQYCIQKGTPYFAGGQGNDESKHSVKYREPGASRIHETRCEHCGGTHETKWHDIGRQPSHLKGIYGEGEGWPTEFQSKLSLRNRPDPALSPDKALNVLPRSTRDWQRSFGAHASRPSAADIRRRGGLLGNSGRMAPESEAAWTRMQDPTTRSILQRFAHRGAENEAISRLPHGQRKGARAYQGGKYVQGIDVRDKGNFPVAPTSEGTREGKVTQVLAEPLEGPLPKWSARAQKRRGLVPPGISPHNAEIEQPTGDENLEALYGRQARGQAPYDAEYFGWAPETHYE